MAYTEFYIQTTGNNLNSGSTDSDSATFTFTNGGWDSGSGVFTATGADLSGVSVGDFASVYLDAATSAVFIGRITAVDNTADTITISTTVKAGTAPTTGATGRSIKVGGAWKGPTAAIKTPFNLTTIGALKNTNDDYPRFNMKSGTDYSITAALTTASDGPYIIEGYTSAPGDGGRATLDGGTSGASYNLFTASGDSIILKHLIFNHNGATGGNTLVVLSGSRKLVQGCVFANGRGHGCSNSGSGVTLIECEAYGNNINNDALRAGFISSVATEYIRCISHSNTTSNSSGFKNTTAGIGASSYIGCIAYSNGDYGFHMDEDAMGVFINCDAYANGDHGIYVALLNGSVNEYIENCNLVGNGGYGIALGGAGTIIAIVNNCGFGSGTMANTSGTIAGFNLSNFFIESGTVTYDSNTTPWVDPDNGDFRIKSSAAKGTGRGTFVQTAAGESGTIAYMDIGAAQAKLPTRSPIVNGGLIQ